MKAMKIPANFEEDEELDYTHMNTILDYLTIDILTMYENNIKQHYIEYVERYVNVIWERKFMTKQIRKIKKTKKDRDSTIRKLNTQLRKIKNDLLNIENTNYKSNSFYFPSLVPPFSFSEVYRMILQVLNRRCIFIQI